MKKNIYLIFTMLSLLAVSVLCGLAVLVSGDEGI